MKTNLIKWVNNPFIDKFANSLEESQKMLKEKLCDSVVNNFGELTSEERLIQCQIIGIECVLNDFRNLIEFRNFCYKNNIELDEAKDVYLLNEQNEIVEEKEHSRLINPFNYLINKLNNNEN